MPITFQRFLSSILKIDMEVVGRCSEWKWVQLAYWHSINSVGSVGSFTQWHIFGFYKCLSWTNFDLEYTNIFKLVFNCRWVWILPGKKHLISRMLGYEPRTDGKGGKIGSIAIATRIRPSIYKITMVIILLPYEVYCRWYWATHFSRRLGGPSLIY